MSTFKVKMLTTSASAEGVRQAGHVYEVEEKEAKELLAGGYADVVTVRKIDAVAERADLPPGRAPSHDAPPPGQPLLPEQERKRK